VYLVFGWWLVAERFREESVPSSSVKHVLDCSTLEYGPDSFSRNIGNQLPTYPA